MRKDRWNALLRTYAEQHLSPTPRERQLVVDVYASVCDVIGPANALQIGSYPRFTAITPLHDLDVLFVLGEWDPQQHNPAHSLTVLRDRLNGDYENPTDYDVRIDLQTHSVTVRYLDGDDEVFAVDVVPAYIEGRNGDGEDMYVVPEIAVRPHFERRALKEAVAHGEREMAWIRSDPRGYIRLATTLNQANEDFRKGVKLVKGWRHQRKIADETFPLKSFHLEQVITGFVAERQNMPVFDIIFEFFTRLPDFIRYPQIHDRADPERRIDEYVANLTHDERRNIDHARDGFLIAMENFKEGDDVADLLSAEPHQRLTEDEAFLFDQFIPMLNEHDFSIEGHVHAREPGAFRAFILDALGRIRVDRKVSFRLGANAPTADIYKWKVKNDDNSPQPRGEITDHRTKNEPEETKYNGHHFVECYAIRNGVCIGRGRQDVILQW
jgi:hypothetical protein